MRSDRSKIKPSAESDGLPPIENLREMMRTFRRSELLEIRERVLSVSKHLALGRLTYSQAEIEINKLERKMAAVEIKIANFHDRCRVNLARIDEALAKVTP